ncbi:hypothetical protein BDFG_03671 [Blastomyces dermatitidis ATCC 26199]|nr:hypothetical protein BDFG_03671 [Blastomyces dermatitidis ATCC 26199]
MHTAKVLWRFVAAANSTSSQPEEGTNGSCASALTELTNLVEATWNEGKKITHISLSVSRPWIRPLVLRINASLCKCTTTCAAKSHLEIRPTCFCDGTLLLASGYECFPDPDASEYPTRPRAVGYERWPVWRITNSTINICEAMLWDFT